MFRPFFMFVGNRYTRVKRKNHFIAFISMTSMLGIALGVMVLITVLSVMNGFSAEIRSKMLSLTPHVTLRGMNEDLADWQPVVDRVLAHPKVIGAAPYIIAHGMLADSGHVQPCLVRGIDPKQIRNVYPLEESIQMGSLEALQPGSFGLILGKELAHALGVWVGDKITLMIPEANVTPAGMIPRIKRLDIVAVFHSSTGYDHRNAFIHLQDAEKIFRMPSKISGIQIRLSDELASLRVAQELSDTFDYQFMISDWTQEHSNFFEAIKMEKTVMWCILCLIIAVAAFNLVSSLVMIVTDKRSDIAIFRTMGASARAIMGIFVVQGAIIGLIGTVLGLGLGLLLAANVTQLVEIIQNLFQVRFISEDVYFIGFVPSVIKAFDVIVVCIISLVMSLLATIYPAWRAVQIKPAEALRYE